MAVVVAGTAKLTHKKTNPADHNRAARNENIYESFDRAPEGRRHEPFDSHGPLKANHQIPRPFSRCAFRGFVYIVLASSRHHKTLSHRAACSMSLFYRLLAGFKPFRTAQNQCFAHYVSFRGYIIMLRNAYVENFTPRLYRS